MSIENKLFELTGQKAMPNDPVVEIIKGFRQVLEESLQDYEERIASFSHHQLIDIKTELDYAVASIHNDLDGSNEYYVGNSINHEKNLAKAFAQLLEQLDTKNKDLNFILAKIQADYDRDSDDRFAKHFASIDERYNQILEIQKKNSAFSQREVLFGIGGVVGVVICLLVVLVVG